MAKDAIEMMLCHYEDNGINIPNPSDIKNITSDEKDYVLSYVAVDTASWRNNNF